MKQTLQIFSFLLFFSIGTSVFGQSKISPTLERYATEKKASDEVSVWIFFNDKGGDLDGKLVKAAKKLSPRTIKRRKKAIKGNEVVTHYDIPVEFEYIKSVEPLLIKKKVTSKWLNAISADITLDNLEAIAALEFVKQVDVVRYGKRNEISTPDYSEVSESECKDITMLDYGPSLTQLEMMKVPAMHEMGFDGEGMLICLMDAGFTEVETHPAFASIDIMDTYDFVNDDTNVDDQDNDMGTGTHGRSTLSCIGAFSEGNLIGPAYNATYLLAKTENTESETTAEEDAWVEAAEWAEGYGVDITSTSLGYVFFDDGTGYEPAEMDGMTATITIASDILASMGVLVVNSAGNSGAGETTIVAPSDGFNVLAIGAVNANMEKAGFSSVGPTGDGRIKPDVMAMGQATIVARSNGDFGPGNGTSFSGPLAAGAAALLWQRVPSATNFEIFEALKLSATNADNPNNEYGWGIIDLEAAYDYLVSQDSTPPVVVCNDLTIHLDSLGNASISLADVNGGVTDNLGIDSVYIDQNEFNCMLAGDQFVTLMAVDLNGNIDSCEANISVLDTIAPYTSSDLNIIVIECELNEIDIPIMMDNCSDTIYGEGDLQLPVTDLGTYLITWSFTDANGNQSTQTQQLLVTDSIPPTPDLLGLPKIEVECELTNIEIPTALDMCSGLIEGETDAIFPITEQGSYLVQWYFDDGNGNIAIQEQEVLVSDTTAPEVSVMDITIDLDGMGSISISPEDADNGTFDNCAITAMELSMSDFSEIGVFAVTLTATDVAGNQGEMVFVVTVVDTSVNTDEEFITVVKIFPNPAQQSFQIDVEGERNISFEVYTMNGKLVLQNPDYKVNSLISLQNLINGQYLVVVKKDEKRKTFTLNVDR